MPSESITPYDPTSTTLNVKVVPFSDVNLAKALSNKWVRPEEMQSKKQFRYLLNYLGANADEDGGLDAKTMVIETPYVSQSYLSDYADYYARGFAKYSRFCKRVHFFSRRFAEKALELAFTDRKDGAIWKSYLGYIVVKPLPATPIGSTLLKHYTHTSSKRRHYPAQRPYPVNVLGRQLTVNTLIFQEQDANVSACATTALWIAFHKTAYLFQTPLPSPYQITASTGNLFTNTGRSFPTTALDLHQVGKAIEAVGLVAELRNYPSENDLRTQAVLYAQDEISAQAAQQNSIEVCTDGENEQDSTVPQPSERERTEEFFRILVDKQLSEVKGFIYAYLRLGLPVLLFLDFCDGTRHLVTVTGYREAAPVTYLSVIGITLLSSSIERIYVHDDQIGPYAQLGFTLDGLLETGWPDSSRPGRGRTAVLEYISVPLIRDIRIQYEQVYAQTALIDQVLYDILNANEDFVWDIYLSYSNTYKDELLQNSPTTPAHLRRILGRLLPKYIWVARATLGANKTTIVDLVFDATDLHTGFYCVLTNIYEPARTPLNHWLSQPANQKELLGSPSFESRYLDLLLNDLTPL